MTEDYQQEDPDFGEDDWDEEDTGYDYYLCMCCGTSYGHSNGLMCGKCAGPLSGEYF